MEFYWRFVSIRDMEVFEGLSVRACNVCRNALLTNLSEIVSYYAEYGDFLRIRNCGRKTNKELADICQKYSSMLSEVSSLADVEEEHEEVLELPEEIEEVSTPLNPVDQLSQSQVDMLNFYIIYLFLRLSKRTSEAIREILCDDLRLKNVWDILLNADFSPSKVVPKGSQSAQEITAMVTAINAQVYHLDGHDEILLHDEEFQRLSRCAISYHESNSEARHSAMGIRIFSLLNELIENGYMFLPREREIFKSCLVCYTDSEKKTLDEIGSRLGITRERVRQIREKIYSQLLEALGNFRALAPNVAVQYGLDAAKPCVAIDETFVGEINMNEGTSFNSHFMGEVLSVILSDRFVLLGDEIDANSNKRLKEGYHWKKHYLIQRQYADTYDFAMLVYRVRSKVKKYRINVIPFNLLAEFPELHNDEDSKMLNEKAAVAVCLLYKELNLIIDQQKNIIINRDIPKRKTDYICEILEELNRPANVYEIYEKLNERCFNEMKSIDSLRNLCRKDQRMIFFGRSSTYGLKVWEEELNLKGGTIRDIVEEFLLQNEEPQHMDDITRYVQMYRNTSKSRISANLNLEKSNRFKFFGHQIWGLLTKEYAQSKLDQSNLLKVRLN